MTLFDHRERAFEDRYAHDAELDFRASARRDKLVGLWAANLLGKRGVDATAYAQEIVHSHVVNPREDMLVMRLCDDLKGRAGLPEIQAYMTEAAVTARKDVMTELH